MRAGGNGLASRIHKLPRFRSLILTARALGVGSCRVGRCLAWCPEAPVPGEGQSIGGEDAPDLCVRVERLVHACRDRGIHGDTCPRIQRDPSVAEQQLLAGRPAWLEVWDCQNAGEPSFLADRTVNNSNGVEEYRQSEPGQFCSYYGIHDAPNKSEEDPLFDAPSGNQRGDGHSNVCAAWNLPGESTFWGVQVRNGTEGEGLLECEAPGVPERRCGMAHYESFSGNDAVNHPEALTERPWASYLVNPVLEVFGSTELRVVETGPDHGNSGDTGPAPCSRIERPAISWKCASRNG